MGNGYRIMNLNLGLGRTLAALFVRPVLLWEAVRALAAVRVHRGLVPSSDYLHWRVHTAYGDAMSKTTSEDLIKFLDWRRLMRDFS
jgi:hypothetical protein